MTSLLNISGIAASVVSVLGAATLAYVPLDPVPVLPAAEARIEIQLEQPAAMSTSTVAALVYPIAELYGANAHELYETIRCESGFYTDRVGSFGELGVAQIYLEAHPDVTPEQARDPVFAIAWSAKEFAAGHERMWTCWRLLFGP